MIGHIDNSPKVPIGRQESSISRENTLKTQWEKSGIHHGILFVL